jgi:excisionase family DNA binding protein
MKSEIKARKRKKRPRKPAEPSSVLIAAVQAARQYGVPYTTLRDLAFRGEIPVVRLGTAWYFERRDLAKFIERSKETLGEGR